MAAELRRFGRALIDTTRETVRRLVAGSKQFVANERHARELKSATRPLTRSERLLLLQVSRDRWKAVPFVPIAVLFPSSLPFLAVLTPGLLPSTFIDDTMRERQRAKLFATRVRLSSRLEDALQRAVAAMRQSTAKTAAFRPRDLATTDGVLGFAQSNPGAFELDALESGALRLVVEYMGVGRRAPTPFLRWRLRGLHARLQEEDRIVASEPLGSLSGTELAVLLSARGMRYDMKRSDSEAALRDWLRLVAAERGGAVSPGLLFFSRPIVFRTQRPSL